MNQIMHILAEEFVNAFIPQSAQAGLIAECAAAFEVHSIDGLGGRVEQQLKFILTFALRLFCPPAFGDFHYHAYHPQHLALFVEVCTTGSIHPNHTTVGTHYSIAELKVRLVRAKGSNRSQKSLSVVWVNLSQSLLASSVCRLIDPQNLRRSEEHTSELQSHLNLVCRLLLEKKKTQEFYNFFLKKKKKKKKQTTK